MQTPGGYDSAERIPATADNQIYIKRLLLLDLTHAPHIHRPRFIIILSVSRGHWQVRGDGECYLVPSPLYGVCCYIGVLPVRPGDRNKQRMCRYLPRRWNIALIAREKCANQVPQIPLVVSGIRTPGQWCHFPALHRLSLRTLIYAYCVRKAPVIRLIGKARVYGREAAAPFRSGRARGRANRGEMSE